MIPLGPFRPDEVDTNQGFLADLSNASLKPDGQGVAYGPLASFISLSTATALAAAPKGSLTVVTAAGVYKNFIMTSTNIYLLNASGVPSSIGSGYNLPTGDKWSSTQYGKYAVFTNKFDGMLRYDIELGGAVTAISGAPKARVVRIIFDTLFALDCDGESKTMRNSDFDFTNWTTGVSGYQPDPDGEELVGIEEVMDGTAVVLQRNAIRTISRTSDASLYTQRFAAKNQGAVNPWCIVPVDGIVYFVDTNGFKSFGSGGIVAIGKSKVSEWFLARLGVGGLASIEGAFDQEREVVRWRYTDGASDTVFTDSIDYDIRLQEFVPVTEATEAIFTTATAGYTMEELDAFGDMDSVALNAHSLDDRFWFGGSPQLGGVDENGIVGYFAGPALAATFETCTTEMPISGLVTSVEPLTDASDVTVQIGVSTKLSTAIAFGTAVATQASGRAPVRARGKNIRLRANIPAASDWTYIRGFDDVVIRQSGPR